MSGNGQLLYDPKKILNELNVYFTKYQAKTHLKPAPSTDNLFFLSYVDNNEMVKAIQSWKTKILKDTTILMLNWLKNRI